MRQRYGFNSCESKSAIANFNDTYWLEEIMVDLNELRDKQELIWFDPFNGRSKENNTLVAISYASDDEFYMPLAKTGLLDLRIRRCLTLYASATDWEIKPCSCGLFPWLRSPESFSMI